MKTSRTATLLLLSSCKLVYYYDPKTQLFHYSIEHVFPDVLEKIPFNIFGFIKPKIAVLTTPNREFNVLFNMPPGTFRHDDHKFEWTRSEFEDWCHHICARFPDYCVQFHGVGNPPTEHQNLGSCSQLGFFIRKDFFESLNKEPAVEVSHPEIVECDNYQLIHSVAYPFFRDLRQRHEKIFDECNYHLNRFRWMEDQYFNWGSDRFEIPLKHVANACWEITDNIEEIRGLVKENFQLENDFVIFPPNIED